MKNVACTLSRTHSGHFMQIDRHFRIADHASKSVTRHQTGLSPWLPWIAAPLFTLLPIVGCWLANSLQEPRDLVLRRPPIVKTVPSNTTIVTVARHNEAF
ncbi:MAG: hypothetical protein HOH16_04905 [Planctomycetaceae bacterium]|nr:hypothetical protein [Planctomycetaceae bacterium]